MVISVNMEGESVEDVRGFVNEFKIEQPVYTDKSGEVVKAYRIIARPTNIFINKNGVITKIVAGGITPDDIKNAIEKG